MNASVFENVNLLSAKSSLISQFLSELRDANIQKDSFRFRRNLERISEIIAYEISKNLKFEKKSVLTQLGEAKCDVLSDKIVIASILRAGLPMHTGLLNYFDKAENAFISAYRKYRKDNSFEIKFEYLSSPEIDDKIIILVDPMLATGSSMVLAYKNLIEKGRPKFTYIVSLIASKEGIDYVEKFMPDKNYCLWVADVDDELTAKGYIVPGLGDAGDLAFGSKI
jgi:uracil phosphoribosyltransferase